MSGHRTRPLTWGYDDHIPPRPMEEIRAEDTELTERLARVRAEHDALAHEMRQIQWRLLRLGFEEAHRRQNDRAEQRQKEKDG